MMTSILVCQVHNIMGQDHQISVKYCVIYLVLSFIFVGMGAYLIYIRIEGLQSVLQTYLDILIFYKLN